MIEDRIFSVYIHRFPNEKQYVGITSIEPKNRWRKGNGYRNNKIMFEDIKKYGWDNIEHILFNEEDILYNEEEACYVEKCLIDSWDLTNPEKGYNLCSGGTSSYTLHKTTRKKISNSRKDSKKVKASFEIRKKPVVQYSLDGKLINKFNSIEEASKQTNIHCGNISKCCNNKYKTANGYIWKFEDDIANIIEPLNPKGVPVVQYSLDGIKLNTFLSIKEAKEKTNILGISNCCNKRIKHSGGFIWRYLSDNLTSVEPQKDTKKQVIQYSLNNKLINEYNSISESSNMSGINSSSISACCKGKRKTAGGYVWKFKDEVDNGC